MTDPEEPGYELVMPFVTVASKGGPHEDQAYTAGWSMGALDALLEHQRPPVVEDTIRDDCMPQADRIAMRHGYSAVFEPTDVGGWEFMQLTRVTEVKPGG